LQRWHLRPDMDASRRLDADFTLDAIAGLVGAGDGERGRVFPIDAPILAAFDKTAGAAGNLSAGVPWQLSGADDGLNGLLLSMAPADVEKMLGSITNRGPATGGANEEDQDHAAGRAAAALWAHERLVELCPQDQCATLDQLDRSDVLGRAAPARATTLVDFERLALDVPGTRVARARAWTGLDPRYPCLKAPGTVSIIVVPELPLGRPQPSLGLLRAVRRYLDRRRVICTRLIVVGPDYLEVGIQAKVRARAATRAERIRQDIISALDAFLDPLRGGPAGRGWPFGRDVYRSEVMQVLESVPGVDHVLAVGLVPGSGEARCGNLCVGPTWLVTPGQHDIEVV
jgi:hypothetical protein